MKFSRRSYRFPVGFRQRSVCVIIHDFPLDFRGIRSRYVFVKKSSFHSNNFSCFCSRLAWDIYQRDFSKGKNEICAIPKNKTFHSSSDFFLKLGEDEEDEKLSRTHLECPAGKRKRWRRGREKKEKNNRERDPVVARERDIANILHYFCVEYHIALYSIYICTDF